MGKPTPLEGIDSLLDVELPPLHATSDGLRD
jgi:hypothetical protein